MMKKLQPGSAIHKKSDILLSKLRKFKHSELYIMCDLLGIAFSIF